MKFTRELSCVECQGKNLCFGLMGSATNTFVPSGMIMFTGFRTRAYVCLDCGHITQYIPEDKLVKLRDRFKIRLD